jgi:lipoprotein NlpD
MCYVNRRVLLSLLLFSVAACHEHAPNYAPVGTAWSISEDKPGTYIVQSGDTLYAIAWRYNLDYRALAEENHLSAPYVVKTGQTLSVRPVVYHPATKTVQKTVMSSAPKKTVVHTTSAKKAVTSPSKTKPLAANLPIRWVWPAKGRIVAHYSPTVGQKGVDIAGQKGEPILAAATGKVAYAGNGLRGYGNLIIIKHSEEFLSAYAHNDTLLVHEGDEIKAGQKIATMGDSEAKRVMLHFEIREAGKSVNPLLFVKP